jgi:hypothetical protein
MPSNHFWYEGIKLELFELFSTDSRGITIKACNSTVSNYMTKAIVDAFNSHHVRSSFEHLELDSAVAATISRLRDNFRTKLSRDVRFLFAEFVALV